MSDDIKDKAIWYWQDSLSKFFPTSKGPTGAEIEMFRAGYEAASAPKAAKHYSKNCCEGFCGSCGTGCSEYSEELFQMRQENERFREALEKVADHPHEPHCAWLDPVPEECNCWLSVAQAALEGK